MERKQATLPLVHVITLKTLQEKITSIWDFHVFNLFLKPATIKFIFKEFFIFVILIFFKFNPVNNFNNDSKTVLKKYLKSEIKFFHQSRKKLSLFFKYFLGDLIFLLTIFSQRSKCEKNFSRKRVSIFFF